MTEDNLQKQIISRLNETSLLDIISNKDLINKKISKLYKENFLFYFSIDYILYRYYIESCEKALRNLEHPLIIINGENIRNISLEENERLYPDILLFNKELNNYIIIELKRDKQTEREAITELLGYQFEIKNTFPLSGNNQTMLILIATDYSVLLQHSINGLLLNQQIVMCLKPIIKRDKFENFEIFIPDIWTNTNYPLLNEEIFHGVTFCIKMKNEDFSDLELDTILNNSLDYLQSDGDLSGNTGFAIASIANPVLKSEYGITDAFIHFFSLNPYKVINNFIKEKSGVIIEQLKGEMCTDMLPKWCYTITKNMRKYLCLFAHVNIESVISFKEYRIDYGNNAIPIYTCMWGEIGCSARKILSHAHFGQLCHNPSSSFRNPKVFFQLFDILTANFPFAKGFDVLDDFFQFGIRIGSELFLLNICIKNEELCYYIGTSLVYKYCDLLNSLQEIQKQFDMSFDATRVSLIPENSELILMVKQLETIIVQFSNVLNGLSYKCKEAFQEGINRAIYYDLYLREICGLSDEDPEIERTRDLYFKGSNSGLVYKKHNSLKEIVDVVDMEYLLRCYDKERIKNNNCVIIISDNGMINLGDVSLDEQCLMALKQCPDGKIPVLFDGPMRFLEFCSREDFISAK